MRSGVEIEDHRGDLLVRYAHWEMRLPCDVVAGSGGLRELAARGIPDWEGDPAASSVGALLAAQGCFLPHISNELRMLEVYRLIQPIRSELYAAYYAHPVWARLRGGTASIGQFAAWALHNYHISRSAGIIAARLATNPTATALHEVFRDDALEEYWHCDAFYFVRGGSLPIQPETAKAYVPLPAIRAFEDIALRAADTDWLAHLLIAYFQESSIVFGEESERFYDEVERRYDVPGFFKGWRRHLDLDRDHGHAQGLAALFDDSRIVSREDAERALRSLQLAHYYLMQALDQVMASPPEFEAAIEQRQPGHLGLALQLGDLAPLPATWWHWFCGIMEQAAFAALSRVRDHDSIMAAGNLAAILRDACAESPSADICDNPWLPAVEAFLMEQAGDLPVFLALCDDLLGLFCPASLSDGRAAKLAAGRAAAGVPSAGGLAVVRAQLAELVELARAAAPLAPIALGAPVTSMQP